jgi:glycosyltransferase involved in cell wall biosynthesis
MSELRPDILLISMRDRLGGAERVAYDLLHGYRARGCTARMVVGQRRTSDPDVHLIPNDRAAGAWSRTWWRAHYAMQPIYGRFSGSRWLCKAAHRLAEPAGLRDARAGREDFNFPGSWKVLDLPPRRPDILHAHNLHSNYFDLRALPHLSAQAPLVVTLHDTWLFSGHCAYSLDCDRWRTGCGACPDLTLHPAIRRDATAQNWGRKREIFAASRLYIASSAGWVLDRAAESILAPAIVETRHIPYGIDLSVFRPGDRAAARAALGLPPHAHILLFAANGIRANAYKDFKTLRSTIDRLGAQAWPQETILVALGEDAPPQRCGSCELRFVPFEPDPARVALYYHAADVYLHAARAEVTPLAVIEALACGLPVVATAVGGVPEQVRTLRGALGAAGGRALASLPIRGQAVSGSLDGVDAHEATGILVPPGGDEAMAAAAAKLLVDEPLRLRLGDNAARDAAARFALRREVDDYLAWFAEILESRAGGPRTEAKREDGLTPGPMPELCLGAAT